MRILSVVTLVSPHGEYGGPVRVAVNQARALIERGHEVVLAGAARGFAELPAAVDGVPAALFPARTVVPMTGFAGLASPGLQRWLARTIDGFDAVHVHAARDLVTLPAARRALVAGKRYVLQTHGMIDLSANPLAWPLDGAMTRRILRGAERVFFLTPEERAGLVAVAGEGLRLQELANGVPVASVGRVAPSFPEVLYLARLAPRKRPRFVVELARRLAPSFPEVRFTLVGPDEGEGDAIRAGMAEASGASISWEGGVAPSATLERMSRASIYVLPSVHEPYPMSVLEAMSLGLPVVITESCGLAPLVRRAGCGFVCDESYESFETAVRRLLADPVLAEAMGERGRDVAVRELSMGAIAAQLEGVYGAEPRRIVASQRAKK